MTDRIPNPSYAFLEMLHKLPKGEQKKVKNRVDDLVKFPEDNGKSKRRLQGLGPIPPPPGHVPFRAYVGNLYRLVYTFSKKEVHLLGIYKKKDIGDDYTKAVDDIKQIPGPTPIVGDTFIDEVSREPEPDGFVPIEETKDKKTNNKQRQPLINETILNLVDAPRNVYGALLDVDSEEQLFKLADKRVISDELALQISEILKDPDPLNTFKFPDTPDAWETIQKIVNGELSPDDLTLKLTNLQRELVDFSFEQNGAVLIKGAAGTGKSLVAQHRVKAYLDYLRGQLDYVDKDPSILYTTYTNALLKDSQKNLENLIGKVDFKNCVEISTVHQVLKNSYIEYQTELKNMNFFQRVQGKIKEFRNIDPVCRNPREENYLPSIMETYNERNDGTASEFFDRIGIDYLADEIEFLIYGHKLNTREKYLKFDRKGRKLGLQAKQRNLIYDVKETLEKKLEKDKRVTWKQLAPVTLYLLNILKSNHGEALKNMKSYDAIVVDEGQDLTPMELKFLSELVPSQNRLFVVSDSTQAIHQKGSVNIQDDVVGVDFQGRVRELKVNYRSTKQISTAADEYLNSLGLENETEIENFYEKGPKPRLWKFVGPKENQIEHEIKEISHELNLLNSREGGSRLSSVGIFTTTRANCSLIETHLNEMGIPARAYASNNYEKSRKSQVTIMPLKAIKGLEFPIVYIAGIGVNFPRLSAAISDDVLNENITNAARELFVGMTRAMRALTVCIPLETSNVLFQPQNFMTDSWDITHKT